MSDPGAAGHPSPRYVVTRGAPTAVELAAVTIALTPVAAGEAPRRGATPAWRRAALLEAAGDRVVRAPWELERLR